MPKNGADRRRSAILPSLRKRPIKPRLKLMLSTTLAIITRTGRRRNQNPRAEGLDWERYRTSGEPLHPATTNLIKRGRTPCPTPGRRDGPPTREPGSHNL